MKIFIRSLKDHSNGTFQGEWIDIDDKDSIDIGDEIDCYLEKRSTATGEQHEEYAIHDYEGEGLAAAMGSSEHPNLDEIALFVAGYEKHKDAWLAYCVCTDRADRCLQNFDETYVGQGKDKKDWAYDYLTESTAQVDPNSFTGKYFNYDSYVSDLEDQGWSFERINKTVYVFQAL